MTVKKKILSVRACVFVCARKRER